MIQENVVHLILFFNSIKYEDTFTQKKKKLYQLRAYMRTLKKNAIVHVC